ncbi:CRISPR-associated Csn1 family endonuclease [Sulfuritortus calidifontis]|uniref:CRISPR-associated endonuclease Cas9 n=1 Tax=Sulfuritortus calidifontis TaxID=1914471 RepID=A0A4R3JZ21_9PROT|nr:type II CRISPR RNA-guided endonuclease Cas9 [Sulfuritortus calidifontis]TCS72991.1 CRISPR-associated Csn1 family endonuclease [Sulfuritortus calidifontis]
MRYRLALDIGSTSIGWCLLRLDGDDKPVAIIRMGVRIFSDGRNPKDGTSLAVTRRNARQMRRRRDRLLKRKERMLAALTRFGFFPTDEVQRRQLVNLDPYALRKKGLYDALSGPEFARALFHINQRRGFLSNRKTDKKDSDSGALKKAIKDLRDKLAQENCQTLGEWLANRHENRLSVRARLRGRTQKDKAYDFYADRAMIEHEFDVLWAKQSSLNPALFNEAARKELKDILLHQRPLKPVKPGRCTLLPDEERAPLALPSTQRFRIYQEVNNLRLLTPDLREQALTLEQRNQVVQLLEHQGEVRFTKILKALKLPGTTKFNLEDIKRDRLKGNATSAALAKDTCFDERWYSFDHAMQDDIVDKLLNEASESALVSWLQEHTGVDEATAERIANTSLPEGYGNLSRAALDRIVPELIKDVVMYSDAVKRAGFDSHSALSYIQQTGEIMDALPYYGIPLRRHVAFAKDNPRNDEERYGKIANPTVHIGLNELRKVVNALIKRYGRPSEIIVEVARELKLSRERKLEIQREQKERQELNDKQVAEACVVLGLTPTNLDRAKRRELSQKMQLWVELNSKNVADRQCPYTGEQIGIERLLSNEVEIEHILPYSMTLDDSMNNKTVSLRRANRDKGNRTPYQAFGEISQPGYDYEAILQRAALMPREKTKRFAPDGYQRWLKEDKDFLARALNDTAYLSRIAKEYLSLVCHPNKVRAIPGRMTALLRGKFGLNQLLSGTESKNRNDHRHHALDAAVIGITDQGLLQRFAQASASARVKQLDRLVEEMPLPWPSYREHVERALENIIVSHKPDHGYQGAMHEDTAWRLHGNGVVSRRIRPEDGGPRQREIKNKSVIAIASTRNPERHGLDENGSPRAYKGYVGGSNYCIEIWRDEKGKWDSDVISTFEAYQLIRLHGEAEGIKRLRNPSYSLSGKPLVMRLMINDLVRLNLGGNTKTMRVVKIGGNGQMFFAEHNEANVDARNKDDGDSFKYVSKIAGSLQTAQGRRVTVSEIGDLRDPGFRG